MRRVLGYGLIAIAVLTLLVWAVSRYIQPVLPPELNSSVVLVFVALLAVTGFLAQFKDVLDLFQALIQKADRGEDVITPHENVSRSREKTQRLYIASTKKGTAKMPQFDVFISYATEDLVFAAEIAGALKANGFRVWLAAIELNAGDKLVDSIQHGLRESSYGVLLISKAFLSKPWTEFETRMLLHESIERKKTIFQIWHDVNKEDVERLQPALTTLLAIPSNVGFPNMISKLTQAMSPRIMYNFEIKAGTGFDYTSILDEPTREFIVIGQNIRSLFRQNAKFLSDMQSRLDKDVDFRIRIILTVQEFFTGISNSKNPDREMQAQFADTIYNLKKFRDSLSIAQRERLTIRFHPGASSLTAFIRDPEDNRRGLIVFVPKWATEITPGTRVFCVVERSAHDALFQSLYGYVPEMYDKVLSISLDEMYARVESKCKALDIEWPPT